MLNKMVSGSILVVGKQLNESTIVTKYYLHQIRVYLI
jgi:hypothetical protein